VIGLALSLALNLVGHKVMRWRGRSFLSLRPRRWLCAVRLRARHGPTHWWL